MSDYIHPAVRYARALNEKGLYAYVLFGNPAYLKDIESVSKWRPDIERFGPPTTQQIQILRTPISILSYTGTALEFGGKTAVSAFAAVSASDLIHRKNNPLEIQQAAHEKATTACDAKQKDELHQLANKAMTSGTNLSISGTKLSAKEQACISQETPKMIPEVQSELAGGAYLFGAIATIMGVYALKSIHDGLRKYWDQKNRQAYGDILQGNLDLYNKQNPPQLSQ